MRILHLTNHVRNTGNGIVNYTIDLACQQVKLGHSVAIASIGGGYIDLLQQHGVEHFTLNQTRKPITLLQASRAYQAIIKKFQPDLVHAQMMPGVVLSRAFKGNAGHAIVSTVHNEFQRSAILMGLADRVIAVSDAVFQSMHRRGIPQKKLRVVRNGTLGSPRIRSLHEYSIQNLNRPAITTVAGMYQRKGIAELIAAFAKVAPHFPQANLYLVGGGPDLPLFKSQAAQTEVCDRIHFEGFQPEPQRYLLSTDIFVLASHKEPFGLVLSEAREAGCAIVASQVGGIPEALDGGKAGVLIPPHDIDALAKSLSDLLSNPEKIKFWQQQSQANLQWLSVERVTQETLAVYEETLDSLKVKVKVAGSSTQK